MAVSNVNMEEIVVRTDIGDIVANSNPCSEEFPEINIFMRRSDGHEVPLCTVSADKYLLSNYGSNGGLLCFVWGDTNDDGWTEKHHWSEQSLLRE